MFERAAKRVYIFHELLVALIYHVMFRRLGRFNSAVTIAGILEGIIFGTIAACLTRSVRLENGIRGGIVSVVMIAIFVAFQVFIRNEEDVIRSYSLMSQLTYWKRRVIWLFFFVYLFGSIPLSILIISRYG
jgi:hypothetical protein